MPSDTTDDIVATTDARPSVFGIRGLYSQPLPEAELLAVTAYIASILDLWRRLIIVAADAEDIYVWRPWPPPLSCCYLQTKFKKNDAAKFTVLSFATNEGKIGEAVCGLSGICSCESVPIIKTKVSVATDKNVVKVSVVTDKK